MRPEPDGWTPEPAGIRGERGTGCKHRDRAAEPDRGPRPRNNPPQFKADAVALYESRPEATIRSVAAGLGIHPETLRNWIRAAG
ncbi:transposase [Streptomyces sp. NPDC051784]|uniref:transposase n=1 Tax=Streptomyces sp. NPDC051784 TaxID=3155805 RepID=UPI00343ADC3E